MAAIDFTKFSFSAEEVRAINDLAFDMILRANPINTLMTIHPNIFTDKKIGFLGEGGLIGSARDGCDPVTDDWKISSRELTWQPKRWSTRIELCANDIINTMAIYAMNRGVDINDLTDSDYVTVITEFISVALAKMYWRIAWFADTNIASSTELEKFPAASAGNAKYFNLINGSFNQLEAIELASGRKVEVSANTEASRLLQLSKFTPTMAFETLDQLYMNAPTQLLSQPDAVIACTQTYFNMYMKHLEANGGLAATPQTYDNLVYGQKMLHLRGIPIMPLPIWDELINGYFYDGDVLFKPHRAVFTTRRNLALGVSSVGEMTNQKIFYSPDKQKTIIDMDGMIDAKVINTNDAVIAS